MGGTESKRRVVVENVNGEAVVQLTDAVVRRVKGQPDPPVQKAPREFKQEKEPSNNNEHRVPPRDGERFNSMSKEIEDFYMEKLNDLQRKSQALQDTSNEQFANAVKEEIHVIPCVPRPSDQSAGVLPDQARLHLRLFIRCQCFHYLCGQSQNDCVTEPFSRHPPSTARQLKTRIHMTYITIH